MEVSSIQRLIYTLQYYTVTQNGVLITEVSAIQRFAIARFHCTCMYVYMYLCTCVKSSVYVCVCVVYVRVRFICMVRCMIYMQVPNTVKSFT